MALAQALPLGDPAIGEAEVAPLEEEALHRAGPRRVEAGGIVVALEAGVGAVEVGTGRYRVERHPRHRPPVVQPWLSLECLGRQVGQPGVERLVAPSRNQRRRLTQRQRREAQLVSGDTVETGGRVGLAAAGQQVGSALLQSAPSLGAERGSGTVEQEGAKERVILVHRLAMTTLHYEAVAPVQFGEDGVDAGVARHLLGVGGGHRRQWRSAQQRRLHRWLEAFEQLAGEVVEEKLLGLAGGFRQFDGVVFAEQQREAGDPAMRELQQAVDRVQCVGADADRCLARQSKRAALIGGEVELGAVEHDELLVEAQSCVGRRWLGPAQHQNVPAAWQGVASSRTTSCRAAADGSCSTLSSTSTAGGPIAAASVSA